MNTKQEARELGINLAKMSDSLQAVALVAMVAEGQKWQKEWEEAGGTGKDLAAHQWIAIGAAINKLPAKEANEVRRLIFLIVSTMGPYDVTPALNGGM